MTLFDSFFTDCGTFYNRNFDWEQFKDLHSGNLFGEYKNYRLKQKLGKGAMGQTWLAEELVDGKPSRQVVLKILTEEMRRNVSVLNEVGSVLDLIQELNHTNICPAIGRFVDPMFGEFFVWKYANGGTLENWFKNQPGHENGLSLETLLSVFTPLAAALDYLHSNGIIHRDIKPQNIMFMGKNPVLIDFGIAAQIYSKEESACSENTCDTFVNSLSCSTSGTPMYMAPEQMEGDVQDGRTDQYAFALCLYAMLTGSLPFSGNIARIAVQKSKFYLQITDFEPHINNAFSRALSYEAKDRFATCMEFVKALAAKVSPDSIRKWLQDKDAE